MWLIVKFFIKLLLFHISLLSILLLELFMFSSLWFHCHSFCWLIQSWTYICILLRHSWSWEFFLRSWGDRYLLSTLSSPLIAGSRSFERMFFSRWNWTLWLMFYCLIKSFVPSLTFWFWFLYFNFNLSLFSVHLFNSWIFIVNFFLSSHCWLGFFELDLLTSINLFSCGCSCCDYPFTISELSFCWCLNFRFSFFCFH